MANQTKTFTLTIDGVEKAITNIAQLEKTVEQLDAELKQAQFGSESFAKLEKEAKLARAELDKISKSTQGVAAQGKAAGETAAKMGSSFADSFSLVNLAGGGVNNTLSTFQGKLGQAQGVIGTVSKAFGTLKGAIASTGIGILLIAFGALVTYFTQTADGMATITKYSKALSVVFDLLTAKFSTVGKALADAFSNPKQALSDFVDFLETNLLNRLNSFSVIIEGIANRDFSKITDGVVQLGTGVTDGTAKLKSFTTELGNAAKAGTEIADENRRIKKEERELNIERAQSRDKIAALRIAADDVTKSTRTRIAAAKEAESIELALNEKLLKSQDDKIANLKKEQSLKKELLKGDDKQALADLEAERADTSRESLVKQRRLLNSIKTLNAEEAAKAKATRDAIRAAEDAAQTLANARQLAAAKAGSEGYLKIQKEKLSLDAKIAIEAVDEKLVKAGAREKVALLKQRAEIGKTAIDAQKKLDSDFAKARSQKAAEDELAVAQVRLLGLEKGTEAYTQALLKQNNAEQAVALAKLENTKQNEAARNLIIAQYQKKNEDVVNEATKAAITKAAQEEADIAAIKVIGQREGTKQYFEAKLAENSADKALALSKLEDTKENESARNRIVADSLEKEKQLRKSANEANRLAVEESIQKGFDVAQQIAGQLAAIYGAQSEARTKALDAQLAQTSAALDAAKQASDDLKSQLDASQSRIDELEGKLAGAKGIEREKIIKQLEQERLKNQQIAADKKKEDARIKAADAQKLAIEKQKTKEQERQAQVQAELNALTAVAASIGAVVAGIEAAITIARTGAKGKVGYDNIALIIGATAAIAGAFVAVKNATKGFAEGGYTGDGGKHEEAGVVHRGEYVIPAHIVANPSYSATIGSLESARTGKGYAQGGLVTLPPTSAASGGSVDMSVLIGMQQELVSLRKDTNAALAKPIYTSRTEDRLYDAKMNTITDTYLR